MLEKPIIIVMEGGVIQDIANIPPHIVVEVRDFDVEGVEPDDLEETEEGDSYVESIHRGEGRDVVREALIYSRGIIMANLPVGHESREAGLALIKDALEGVASE